MMVTLVLFIRISITVVYCLNLLPAPLLFYLDFETFTKVLSEHIGTDWKALARALELSRTDIDAIEYENRFSLKDQIYEFFYKWKQREGKNASIQKLVSGLKAEKLEEPLRKMGEAGLLPEGKLTLISECGSILS